MSIHEAVAKDLMRDQEYELRCTTRGNSFPLVEYRAGEFLRTGWPKCCGYTMRLEKVGEVKEALRFACWTSRLGNIKFWKFYERGATPESESK